MDVSVIIVNYNTRDVTLQCLESVYSQTQGVRFEIIVVDNASSDGSVNAIRVHFPDVILIISETNLGFGRANNIAAKKAKGKYLFLLNSDCILLNNAILIFFDFMEFKSVNKTIGAIGGLLLDDRQQITFSYQKFPNIRNTLKKYINNYTFGLFGVKLFNFKNINYKGNDGNIFVEVIIGADIFLSNSIFTSMKGFDEDYFLFTEETDLQKRMDALGLKRMIIEGPRIIHLKGYSSKTTPKNQILDVLSMDSRYKYFRKNHSFIYSIFYYLLITPFYFIEIMKKSCLLKEKLLYLKVLSRINKKNLLELL